MNLKERAAYYRRLLTTLNQTRDEDAIKAGFNAAALVKARVQRSGENYLGEQFSPYTQDYAKYGRTAKGYQDAYVDFTRTGQLMKSIGVEVSDRGKDFTTVAIRPDNPIDQKKVDGAFKKRGNILLLSEKEREIISKNFLRLRQERMENER